jgi:hypothetical protein
MGGKHGVREGKEKHMLLLEETEKKQNSGNTKA